MRPSHLLLPLFAGFLVVVVPGSFPNAFAGVIEPDGSKSDVGTQRQQRASRLSSRDLQGRLVDEVGLPVGGAKLSDLLSGQETVSEMDGSFCLVVAAGRRVHLAAEAENRSARVMVLPTGDPLTVVLRADRPWIKERRVSVADLHSGQGLIRGSSGRTVVTVCETGERVFARGDGNYSISVPNQDFHLIAHDSAGRVAMSDTIPAPRADQRMMPLPDLALDPGLSIAGRLQNVAGEPLAGASLLLHGHGEERRLVSDDDGAFGTAGLLAGDYVVRALPLHGEVGSSKEFALTANEQPKIEIALAVERPLRLQVVEQGGEAVAGVWVQVTEAGNSWASGRTDRSGEVTLRGLADGDLSFEVFRRDVTSPVAPDGENEADEGAREFVAARVLRFDADSSTLVVE